MLLDKGGIYAVANLRGGGEYGEAWHDAGMFGRKQNVFDDFIAAAEWLVTSRLLDRRRIAIEGGSNGGLLTGAVMVQRPELFGAVVCRVPVVDMLRYHLLHRRPVLDFRIRIGRRSEAVPVSLRVLPAAPRQGRRRVSANPDYDGGHGRSRLARHGKEVRGKAAGRRTRDDTPVLIRVETQAGHGAGKPVSKMIEEDADIFAFLFKYLKIG